MQIINQDVSRCIEEGIGLKIDLGAGPVARPGFFSLDHLPLKGVDIVADLNKPFELLPDGCCTHLTAYHVLEHIVDLLPMMAEVHRILAPGGIFDVVVPHFANPFAYSDPTHVRFFGIYSMHYFADGDDQPGARRIPNFYAPTRFRIEDIRVRFEVGGMIDGILGRAMNRLVNRNFESMAQWERRAAWLIKPAEIHYRLRPKK
jgi:Uncharacterized protein conserved in bacteria